MPAVKVSSDPRKGCRYANLSGSPRCDLPTAFRGDLWGTVIQHLSAEILIISMPKSYPACRTCISPFFCTHHLVVNLQPAPLLCRVKPKNQSIKKLPCKGSEARGSSENIWLHQDTSNTKVRTFKHRASTASSFSCFDLVEVTARTTSNGS